MSLKLNIGSGSIAIEGFTPIDRDLGTEAYPLPYDDNSVEEIRASHILEHFSFAEAMEALKEWNRVLQPGGKIRIAVPGFEQITQLARHDDKWMFYLMGGQTDSNDFHKSAWSSSLLHMYLQQAGFEQITPWQSDIKDCASLPCSLNLEAIKAPKESQKVKIAAVMSLPRVGWNDAWGQVVEALYPFRIPIRRFTGVFWGQCMQRVFNECVADGVDWILSIDYDSMFTSEHVDRLLGMLGSHPEIDALAALQQRRGQGYPLMTCGKKTIESVTLDPIRATTAHFGLTLIRVDALKEVPKPWFYAQPDENCEWHPDGEKLDEDIWFWHIWKKAGKTVYVDPGCRIGHLEVMVAEFDEDMQPQHRYVTDWRKRHGLDREANKNADSKTPLPVEAQSDGGSNHDFPQLSGEFDPARRVRPGFRDGPTDWNGNGNGESANGMCRADESITEASRQAAKISIHPGVTNVFTEAAP